MSEQISRRGFVAAGVASAGLVGLGAFGVTTKQAEAAFVRPPGAHSDTALTAACNRCQKCMQACPYGVITTISLNESLISYGTPKLNFETSHCNFCMKCAEACPTRALSADEPKARDVGVAVVLSDACVAWDWIGCCSKCVDECPVDGALKLDDWGRPVVNPDVCDGCGKCEEVCPSASYRAYNDSLHPTGIVVVSRATEAALSEGALTSEEFRERVVQRVVPGSELPVHTQGVHPYGEDKSYDTQKKQVFDTQTKEAIHENA